MADFAPYDLLEHRWNWVRLRTLIVLRWIAIFGQLAAITVAQRLFNLDLNVGLCFMAIGVSIVANLFAVFLYPENKRLSEPEVAGTLLFDILQLTFLVFLTGGLNNPFAVLIIAPVAISAMALKSTTTALIAGVSICLVVLLAFVHLPLVTKDGLVLEIPPVFVFGFLTAIIIGVLFLSVYASRVTSEVHAMSEALTATQMALAREQKLTDLGGVVAAAAHELGTPLATIKLASAELIEELTDDVLREDAKLIRDQANRCRDILRSMGRAGKDDLHLRHAPFAAIIREAAEPHADRGIAIHYDIAAASLGSELKQPIIARRPEIIHGVRNLVQNAVDFARANVWIDIFWDEKLLTLRIIDDGPGFSPTVMNRIGDPFVRQRKRDGRQGYEGMGLGLFIAKTLLERSGAEMTFANGSEDEGAAGQRTGAVVEARWRHEIFAEASDAERSALGDNRPIQA